MKLKVKNSKGKETGREVQLPKDIYSIEPNEHALYLDVKQFLSHQRQGTHKAKERADIVGSTRKIKKQKEQELQELEVLNQEFLEVEVEFLVRSLEITI